MSTVEMEIFSNPQLIVMTIVMFVGGEVFTSVAGHFMSNSKPKQRRAGENVASLRSDSSFNPKNIVISGIESRVIMNPKPGNRQAEEQTQPSAKDILKRKGLNLFTFSLFTTVSTFSNCGFVPTNENMLVFAKNSGLLLILIPQVLQGNSLFPACLRFSIWVLGKVVRKVEYSNYLLKNTRAIGYHHLLPNRRSCYLVFTVFGFTAAQLIFFCAMEWNSEALIGLDPYEKIIGLFFQSVNTRHTGETIVDLSTISAAILVILIVMMSVSLSLSLSFHMA
ncbi:High-affinity K+ transporter 1, putative [Theobroma cacao]|uniref:High-affinity K+ transporter 1, putative n=1 Tax=Theobroma cacao TaxID=3641 RepID=A0A061F424_THECC|nr:High-affinity K+ transporter 1, putative [Theobroma cacao]